MLEESIGKGVSIEGPVWGALIDGSNRTQVLEVLVGGFNWKGEVDSVLREKFLDLKRLCLKARLFQFKILTSGLLDLHGEDCIRDAPRCAERR